MLALVALVAALAAAASAQVIMRPGGNRSGVTIIEPTFEPPYHLTVSVYVTAQDGRPLPPPLGANLLVIDSQGRRVGVDEGGRQFAEVPNAAWAPVVNPQPNAPVGPRGLAGSGVTLNEPADGHYVLEVAGTDHVLLDLAVAQWDRAGRRRWLHFARASTEPGAVDRWDIAYTAATRPPVDVAERRDNSYVSFKAWANVGGGFADAITELLVTDPRGRRLGRDPRTNRDYHEIPRSGYDNGTGDIEARDLELIQLTAGPYLLDVIGTASGHYELELYASDAPGQSSASADVREVPTDAGLVHRYRLEWPAVPGVEARLAGAWSPGGALLSYAYPLAPRTELPAGETSVTLIVFYASRIVPGSFVATLGGHDVTARFKPAAAGHEAVTLPLAPGSNALVLSVRGNGPDGRTLTQTDRLELVRR